MWNSRPVTKQHLRLYCSGPIFPGVVTPELGGSTKGSVLQGFVPAGPRCLTPADLTLWLAIVPRWSIPLQRSLCDLSTLHAMSSTLPHKHDSHYLSTAKLSTASSSHTTLLLQLTTVINSVSLISISINPVSIVLYRPHISLFSCHQPHRILWGGTVGDYTPFIYLTFIAPELNALLTYYTSSLQLS